MSDRLEDLHTWSKEDLIILVEALTLERDRLQKEGDECRIAYQASVDDYEALKMKWKRTQSDLNLFKAAADSMVNPRRSEL